MIKIKLVGAGALGSVLGEEISKSAFSSDVGLVLDIYDFDDVEDRNCAAQNFAPGDIGKFKAEVLAERCKAYAPRIEANSYVVKLTDENVNECLQLDEECIIVDCVDNLAARELLWLTGTSNVIPVMHVGMFQGGTGLVSWNYKSFDSFPLSPANRGVKYAAMTTVKDPAKLPPCELNGMRGMTLNTVMAARDALFLFMGYDLTGQFRTLFEENGKVTGTMTHWNTSLRTADFDPNQSTIEEWTIPTTTK